jgi:hypothetical protein
MTDLELRREVAIATNFRDSSEMWLIGKRHTDSGVEYTYRMNLMMLFLLT